MVKNAKLGHGSANKDLKKMLRAGGFKATGGRLAILEIFKNSKRPLAAQEIIVELASRRHDADQATVYRTLKSLKTNGVIRQIDLRHNHAHYELADMTDHHHLICLRCGRVEDVHRCNIEDMEKAVLRTSKHFSEIKQHSLEFYGLCRTCSTKAGKPENVFL